MMMKGKKQETSGDSSVSRLFYMKFGLKKRPIRMNLTHYLNGLIQLNVKRAIHIQIFS